MTRPRRRDPVREQLKMISRACYDCRDTFDKYGRVTHWQVATGSQADADRATLKAFDPTTSTATVPTGGDLVNEVAVTFLQIAAGHLAGLGSIYGANEVWFAPPPLVRSVLENAAQVVWVLGKPTDPPQARLARAYLEDFVAQEYAKQAAGRMGSKTDQVHVDAVKRWKASRTRALKAFPGDTAATIGAGQLGGQKLPGPSTGVTDLFNTIRKYAGGNISERQAEGIYDFLSNGTHPTLYQARQMREYVVHDKGSDPHLGHFMKVDLGFLERLVTPALIAYVNALGVTVDHMGLDRGPVEALVDRCGHTIPGMLT